MKYRIPLLVLFTVATKISYAQQDILPTQYHLISPVYNSALTGKGKQFNGRIGYLQQRSDIGDAPSLVYFHGEASLTPGGDWANRLQKKRSKWTGDGESTYNRNLEPKIGLGGFYIGSDQGVFSNSTIGINTAIHLPVSQKNTISLGISPRVFGNEIDLSGITVDDPVNDLTYQSLLENGTANTFFQLSSGVSFYSDNFSFSYAVNDLVDSSIGGNEDLGNEKNNLKHILFATYTFELGPKFELEPVTYFRFTDAIPAFFDITIRGIYDQKLWTGISYRNDEAYIMSFGFDMNNGLAFGYSYQHQTGILNDFNNGSHELALGITLD